jgi:hypothetical protein
LELKLLKRTLLQSVVPSRNNCPFNDVAQLTDVEIFAPTSRQTAENEGRRRGRKGRDETVAQVFYREEPHPQAPHLQPDADGLIWMPEEGFQNAFAQNAADDVIAGMDRSGDSCLSASWRGTIERTRSGDFVSVAPDKKSIGTAPHSPRP